MEIGYEFGDRIITGYVEPKKSIDKRYGTITLHERYLCRCKCGKESIIYESGIKSGKQDRCMKCARRFKINFVQKGTVYGTYTVISDPILDETRNGEKHCFYLCRCTCGNERRLRSTEIKKGRRITCLECHMKLQAVNKKRDKKAVIGETFGELTVIGYTSTKTGKESKNFLITKCSCGKIKKRSKQSLEEYGTSMCVNCYRDRVGLKRKKKGNEIQDHRNPSSMGPTKTQKRNQ